MKKLFCFLAALAIIAISAQAQKDGGGGGFQWGVKLGPNFSSWTGSDAEASSGEDKKMKIGVHGGIFVNVPITDMFYFQPELLYSSQGVVYETSEEKATITTSYINLPLTLRLQTTSGFYVVFGPQLGFSLGGKTKLEAQGQEVEVDIDDELRGMIFSGLVGLGFKSASGFGVYARYGHGFSKVFDIEGESEQPKVYDSNISLSLFYMFGGSK